MIQKTLTISTFLFCVLLSHAQSIEPFSGNYSRTYDEVVEAYEELAKAHDNCTLLEMGMTDIGLPLHLFVINNDKVFDPNQFDDSKAVLLINNGIHPGEPCGIDAGIKLSNDLLNHPKEFPNLLDNTILCIIPVYNIGGALNRGKHSRANQNGPDEYGFRGNAKNLDLNRDFVKCDSENAKSFNKIFHSVNPHVMIDTHTSNGADYQYIMTMITTQPDKATSLVGEYIREEMEPSIYSIMEEKNWGMGRYVHTMGRTPDKGIMDFLETPRYSTGYAALFNTIGFTSETHMFKPFHQRVESTYQFELAVLEYMSDNSQELIDLKNEADQLVSHQRVFDLAWAIDTSVVEKINFKGFEAEYQTSSITGKQRLKYNRDKPWEKEIDYYPSFKPTKSIAAPKFYIIPQAWKEVIARLALNNVKMRRLEKDTTLTVQYYQILDFNKSDRVYEGHYPNRNVEVEFTIDNIDFRKGDYLIETNQSSNRYIIETLEPQAVDAFFVWNFFDSAMQQKEWFSDYIFEDEAETMLAEDEQLRREFELKKSKDKEFSESHWFQLYWLYERSKYFEPSYNRYPVYRSNANL